MGVRGGYATNEICAHDLERMDSTGGTVLCMTCHEKRETGMKGGLGNFMWCVDGFFAIDISWMKRERERERAEKGGKWQILADDEDGHI